MSPHPSTNCPAYHLSPLTLSQSWEFAIQIFFLYTEKPSPTATMRYVVRQTSFLNPVC